MVQTIDRCHVSLLKNAKMFAFFWNMTKGIKVINFYKFNSQKVKSKINFY